MPTTDHNFSPVIEESQLPPVVLDALYGPEEEDTTEQDRLTALGLTFAKMRDEAVSHRASSGIEDVWAAAEDAYHGIDDANRAQVTGHRWMKSLSLTGPLTKSDPRTGNEEIRSTVFVPLTRRYVDAGYAKVTETLFPPDDKSFSLSPTPVPELIKDRASLERVLWQDGPFAGLPMERDMTPQEMQAQNIQPGLGELPPGVPITKKDLVEEAIAIATEKAKKAERRIYDWMVESGYRREGRKIMFDSARLGVGILKGPCPQVVQSRSLQRIPGQNGLRDRVVMQMVEEIKPASQWVDPWNFFPDPACGENIHHGAYVFERDFFSTKRLRELAKIPGYHADLIDRVIEEGPSKKYTTAGRRPQERDHKDEYEVWYGYGTVKREDLELVNPAAVKDIPKDQTHVHAIMTLVNDTVIYGTLHPLNSGSFPYRVHCWTRRSGSWAGIGVGEQICVPQRIVNGATRAMMNDAGMSCGAQIVMDLCVEPVDGQRKLTPNKAWIKNADATVDDVRKAFVAIEIPNHTAQLMSIVQYGFRLAEEASSIPLVTQGQSGTTTPETYGATQLQNNNANQLLRSIGDSFDDAVTEPTVKDYYEYLLMDPDVPEEEKGDFQINAHGSVALVERAIQDQTLWQMNQIVMADNEKVGVDPKKWFALIMKSRHLDPREVQFTPEEQAKKDSLPPPPPPQVMVAQLRAQAEARENALDRQLALQIAQLERDRETVFIQAETQRTQVDRAAKFKEIEAKINLAILDYSNKRGIAVEQVKARLASDTMKLKVQQQLAGLQTKGAPQVATPAMEPVGRAPNGEAFQK